MRIAICLIYAAVAALVQTTPCLAKDSITGIDGKTLLEACQDAKSQEGQALCTSYLAGFKDTVVGLKLAYKSIGSEIQPLYCLPDEGLSHREMITIIVRFIADQIKTDPNSGKANAATLALLALYRSFPCQTR